MTTLADKIQRAEAAMAQERGPFEFFALFLREDSPGLWDVLVAAPWIEQDKGEALRYIVTKVKDALEPTELAQLSRIALIDTSNPSLGPIMALFSVEHSQVRVQNTKLFGLEIRDAFIITSRRSSASHPP